MKTSYGQLVRWEGIHLGCYKMLCSFALAKISVFMVVKNIATLRFLNLSVQEVLTAIYHISSKNSA